MIIQHVECTKWKCRKLLLVVYFGVWVFIRILILFWLAPRPLWWGNFGIIKSDNSPCFGKLLFCCSKMSFDFERIETVSISSCNWKTNEGDLNKLLLSPQGEVSWGKRQRKDESSKTRPAAQAKTLIISCPSSSLKQV